MKAEELMLLNPRDYDNWGFVSTDTILDWFKMVNAYWAYPGEPSPEIPHAVLTSGLCSNGYFNVPELLKYLNIAEILGRQLARRLLFIYNIGRVDWVVSSAYSAITLGHEVAKGLCGLFGNTEKDSQNEKRQLWRRMNISAGSRVLQVEELITTTGTVEEVRRAVTEGNPEPVNFIDPICTLVLRPPKLLSQYGSCTIVALIEKEIQNFDSRLGECPYCKAGSPRFSPKTHWKELTGRIVY